MTFYLNGENTESKAWQYVLPASTSKLMIGKDLMEGKIFSGILDDLRIYNRALTDSEILSLYTNYASTATLPGFQNKLVAYYPFDGNANDSSEYANNGTAMGSSVTYVNSVKGKGVKLGNNSWIEVNDSDSLDIDKAFTFSAWVYRD